MKTQFLRVLPPSVCFLLLAVSAPAWAQSTGRLSGIVRDPSGAAVPDATVSLYRPGMTDPSNQARTTAAGLFEFDALPPESYRVTIEKPGFAQYEATDVRVSPGTETPLNGIVLSLGQQPTSINASEKLQGVQTSNAEVATTLRTEQLDRLPILNRNPLDLMQTQAGVVSRVGNPTAIDGLRTSFSNVTLDAINIQDNTVRTGALDYVPNNVRIGQVSQFTLVTSNQAAIYGNGVTQTAFATPSGTNTLHGSVFYLNSNNDWNSTNWFQNAGGRRDAYKSNQPGFNVGGPLIKDKLFGYVDYELFRERQGIGIDRYVPSTETHNILGNFSGLNPAIAQALNAIPYPNIPGTTPFFVGSYNDGPAYLAVSRYDYQQRGFADDDNALVKFDFIQSEHSTFVASWAFDRQNNSNALSLYGNEPASTWRSKANLFSLSWRYSPTARLTNELRAGVDLAPVGISNNERTTPYNLVLGPLNSFNPVSSSSNQGRTLRTFGFQDNASYLIRRHNLQFGFQVQLIRIDNFLEGSSVPTLYLGDSRAQFNFIDQLVGVLQGKIALYTQTLNPLNRSGVFGPVPYITSPRVDNYAPYFQDNWRISRRLALTLGLRYDYYTPFSDSSGILYTPAVLNGNVIQTIASPTPTYRLTEGNLYLSSRKHFAPTVGLAFDPFGDGKTVFRAGYNIAYVNDDLVETPLSLRSNGLALGDINQLVNVTLPQVPRFATPDLGLSGASILAPPGTGSFPMYIVDPHLKVPYVQQWNVGIQRELAGMILDLRYVGNHATRMLREDVVQYQNNVAVYTSNATSSSYNALQFDVSRRLRPNLQFQANYTYAHALTNADGISAYSFDPFRDQNNHQIDRGPSRYDIRHAFKTNFIYDLPWKSNNLPKALGGVLGGWSVSSIIVAQSGAPFSILSSFNGTDIVVTNANGTITHNEAYVTANTNLQGSALGKVVTFNMTANGPSIIASSATNLDKNSPFYTTGLGSFPGQAFFTPPAGSPGLLQPRSFFSPASFDWDLGIQKRFKITERQTLEFRGVAVNVLNHPSFGFNDQFIGNSDFGHDAFALYLPRRVQLSVYYRF